MPGPASFQRQSKRHGQVLLLLIGVASILLMPVDYRGGAKLDHPHATAQLLIDLSHGSLNHHIGDSQFGHWPGLHLRSLAPSRPAEPQLAPDPGRSWMSPLARSTVEAMLSQANATTAAAVSDDEPSLAPRSVTVEKIGLATALLPAGAWLPWHRPSSRLHWRLRLAWQGHDLGPEPPPPQSA